MSTHARTREFVRAQRTKGRNDPEIPRILKRAIAREVFKSLARGLAAPGLDDLRPARQAKNIPLSAAAAAIGTYISKIARTQHLPRLRTRPTLPNMARRSLIHANLTQKEHHYSSPRAALGTSAERRG
ncbi:hypothetical protein [Nocardia sp. NPDC004711]